MLRSRKPANPFRYFHLSLRVINRALKRYGGAEWIVTDGLRSYRAAM